MASGGWLKQQENQQLVKLVVWIAGLVVAGLWIAFVYFDGKSWLTHYFAKTATYKVCVGEQAGRCTSGFIHLPCGTNVAGWLKASYPEVCKYVSESQITSVSGNQCGYSHLRPVQLRLSTGERITIPPCSQLRKRQTLPANRKTFSHASSESARRLTGYLPIFFVLPAYPGIGRVSTALVGIHYICGRRKGTPVEVFTIEGTGSYVDAGLNTPIGSYTIGSKIIGGGGEATAHPFEVDFPIHTDRFQHISVRFEATDIGYTAINSYTYKDVRDKGRRSLTVKTV